MQATSRASTTYSCKLIGEYTVHMHNKIYILISSIVKMYFMDAFSRPNCAAQ